MENLNAKLDSYTQGMLREQRETELREQLKEMFKPKIAACYQDLECLPALDQVTPSQDKLTLIVFRPSPTAMEEITRFFDHQQYKNRVLFLTGLAPAYEQVLQRSAELRAIKLIVQEFDKEGRKPTDPQYQDAVGIETKTRGNFYQACRETFQTIHYPTKNGLSHLDLELKYVANSYEGEQQIVAALAEAYKYTEETGADTTLPRRVEEKLWPAEQKEVAWSDIKRRVATDPSWIWCHPRALDDLKQEMVKRDLWRDLGNGYLLRGPFPKPATSVTVQELPGVSETDEVTLRVKPLHADTVYMGESGTATTGSQRLENLTFRTSALVLSFLAVDSKKEHETGEAFTWKNRIVLKQRLYQSGSERMCELKAYPRGDIRYTVDGSSPTTSGQVYQEPFAIPSGTRVILAVATAEGITSDQLRIDVPQGTKPVEVNVDPNRPATWKRAQKRDSTTEVYQWLELAVKLHARVSGVALAIAKDHHWAELRADEELFQAAEKLRDQAGLLAEIVPGGNLSLDTASLQFDRGQDLIDLVADLRTTLQVGEVIQ